MAHTLLPNSPWFRTRPHTFATRTRHSGADASGRPMEQPRPAATQAERQLLSVAPMMDWTDLHYRQMARLLSRKTWLWTEMVVDKTIIHNANTDRFLWFPPEQRPIVCQLGGSDPETLAAATRRVIEYGYDEINLNCGCPSDRVAGAGCFGAALMLEPELVARCMAAMGEAAQGTPVTVKCRLGVDQVDSYDAMHRFVKVVSEGSPVRHFIIHARKCFLKGLNPHQNRTIPPLRYEWVWGLKRDFPHLTFSLNGGIQGGYEGLSYITYPGPFTELDKPYTPQQHNGNGSAHTETATANGHAANGHSDAATQAPATGVSNGAGNGTTAAAANGDVSSAQRAHSHESASSSGQQGSAPVYQDWIEGVMIGRQAYNDPWGTLADVDRAVFGEPTNPAQNRRQVLRDYAAYAAAMQGRWEVKPDGHQEPNVRALMKPILNLFHGEKGSKKWKSEVDAILKDNPPSVSYVLDKSLHLIPDEVLDAPPVRGPVTGTAAKDKASIAEPPQVSLPRLPRSGDRAGNNQDPYGVDTKRGKGATGGAHVANGSAAYAGDSQLAANGSVDHIAVEGPVESVTVQPDAMTVVQ